MTIRQYARHRQIALSHVEVAVSFHHQDDGAGRDVFERAITLNGDLNDEQRMQLLQFADMCPVGKVLGLNADIRTHSGPPGDAFPASASYADDLSELPIPNIDPD
jgi:putative redox protein